MLRALDPAEPTPPPAYRVPWRIDRSIGAHPIVTNAGATAVDFVRVFVESDGMRSESALWGQMIPGEAVDVCVCDLDPDDVVVTLAWFRPETGVEYVWRFAV